MTVSARRTEPPPTSDTRAVFLGRIESEYVRHLTEITGAFNGHALRAGLGIRLDATKAIEAARRFQSIVRVKQFLEREDDSGVLHDAQLMTAIDCVAHILQEPRRNGLVLGAMQSGKTTTSLALQFAGPIIYLLTGRRIYPLYLVTPHTSQEDQTKIELKKFLDYYGDIEVVLDEEHRCSLIDYAGSLGLDHVFELLPTIDTYRSHVLQGALEDVQMGPRLEDFVQRRVRGQGVRRVADLCRRANDAGFSPLLIIDEPQYGASDRLVTDSDGNVERRPCVLLQIFRGIEEELAGDASDHVFVGLSATPYELNDLDAVWRAKQYLTPAYSGFNYFEGEVLSDGMDIAPPRTMGFSGFAQHAGLPFFANIDLRAYDAQPAAFARFARKIGFTGSQDAYRARVEDSVRAAIYYMTANSQSPAVGICARLFNDNNRSRAFLRRLGLDPARVQIIEWFGSEFRGQSVKRAIENRTRKDLPFVIAVTNRARMGDAFPRSVEWFVDFSRKAADLNALLQGLLGRACGYHKNSTVLLSDDNAAIVDDYIRSNGDLIYKPSRHSVVVGNFRRGAPTSLIRVHASMDDPVVRRFFERLQHEVVEPQVRQGTTNLNVATRRMRPFRTGAILQIAEESGLFAHLEDAEVRGRLFPSIPTTFRIARADDQVRRARGGTPLTYMFGDDGNVRFTFRWTQDSDHAGVQSRGYGERDATDRARAGDKLEPQIHLRKRDPATGDLLYDKESNSADQRAGNWEAATIILPLVDPVRELRSGDAAFPVQLSPYSELMTDDERRQAGFTD